MGGLLLKRGLAYVFDIILVSFIILAPFKKIISKEIVIKGDTPTEIIRNLMASQEMVKEVWFILFIVSILSALLLFAYFVLLEYGLGQSVGKMVFKIEVKTKGKLTLKKCMIRNITKALFLTDLSILFVIDVLYMIFSKNLRLTEKWSGTFVKER
jgi:uncharacterized RDD family membrane protein YckC